MSGIDLAEQKRITEYAAKTAETFVSAYYAATDAPHRGQVRAWQQCISIDTS